MFCKNLGDQLLAFLSMLVCGIFVIESGQVIYDHIRRDYAAREKIDLVGSQVRKNKN